ncbi:amidohydrolase family protein, partial [Streptomyces sp. NPDC059564]|uniref:amidohydrolase family protein n=1 Tax=Streptomyces sp. NPDC059564 TaxID=3346865 RepID=UPI0036980978
GVTTVLDMATPHPDELLPLRHHDEVADLYSAGYPAVAPKSTQTKKMGYPESIAVTGSADADRFIGDQIRRSVDYIKIIVDDPQQPGTAALSPETIAALITRAHGAGLKVIAHAMTPTSIRTAVDAGVDILTHAPIAGALDPGLAAEVAAKDIVVSPTLTMMRGLTAALGRKPLFRVMGRLGLMPRMDYASARRSTAAHLAAGVTIIAGTDSNQDPTAPFSPPAGQSLHEELALLVDAGLSPAQALRGATVTAAEVFGLTDRGVIEGGRRADLLLIDGDPTQDIGATTRIRGVWIKGRRVR